MIVKESILQGETNTKKAYHKLAEVIPANIMIEIRNENDLKDITVQELIDALIAKGITFVAEVDEFREKQIKIIDTAFEAELAKGVTTSINGIVMKADFEDASIVLQVAEWLTANGQTHMTLKDINRVKHSVTIADGVTVGNEIAANYMTQWNKRETLVDQIMAAETPALVELIVW